MNKGLFFGFCYSYSTTVKQFCLGLVARGISVILIPSVIHHAMAAIAAVISLLSVLVKISSAKSLPRLIHIHVICLDKLLDDIDFTIRQIASVLKN